MKMQVYGESLKMAAIVFERELRNLVAHPIIPGANVYSRVPIPAVELAAMRNYWESRLNDVVMSDGRKLYEVTLAARAFPFDGTTKIIRNGEYCWVRYNEGPGDKAWMACHDKSYITFLDREGRLQRTEPAIWQIVEGHRLECRVRIGELQRVMLRQILDEIERNVTRSLNFSELKQRWAQDVRVRSLQEEYSVSGGVMPEVEFTTVVIRQIFNAVRSNTSITSMEIRDDVDMRGSVVALEEALQARPDISRVTLCSGIYLTRGERDRVYSLWQTRHDEFQHRSAGRVDCERRVSEARNGKLLDLEEEIANNLLRDLDFADILNDLRKTLDFIIRDAGFGADELLQMTGFTDDELNRIFAALSRNESVEVLRLTGISCKAHVSALVSMFRAKRNFIKVDLTNTRLDDTMGQQILESLRSNERLVSFMVEGNGFSADTQDRIATLLTRNRKQIHEEMVNAVQKARRAKLEEILQRIYNNLSHIDINFSDILGECKVTLDKVHDFFRRFDIVESYQDLQLSSVELIAIFQALAQKADLIRVLHLAKIEFNDDILEELIKIFNVNQTMKVVDLSEASLTLFHSQRLLSAYTKNTSLLARVNFRQLGVFQEIAGKFNLILWFRAASIGDCRILEELSGVVADINAGDACGDTALHLALKNKHLPAVRVLVEVLGCNVRALNLAGLNCIDLGREELLEYLKSCPRTKPMYEEKQRLEQQQEERLQRERVQAENRRQEELNHLEALRVQNTRLLDLPMSFASLFLCLAFSLMLRSYDKQEENLQTIMFLWLGILVTGVLGTYGVAKGFGSHFCSAERNVYRFFNRGGEEVLHMLNQVSKGLSDGLARNGLSIVSVATRLKKILGIQKGGVNGSATARVDSNVHAFDRLSTITGIEANAIAPNLKALLEREAVHAGVHVDVARQLRTFVEREAVHVAEQLRTITGLERGSVAPALQTLMAEKAVSIAEALRDVTGVESGGVQMQTRIADALRAVTGIEADAVRATATATVENGALRACERLRTFFDQGAVEVARNLTSVTGVAPGAVRNRLCLMQ